MAKRIFIDALDSERCIFTIPWGKGELSRCGRYKKLGQYCRQHQAIIARQLVEKFILSSCIGDAGCQTTEACGVHEKCLLKRERKAHVKGKADE